MTTKEALSVVTQHEAAAKLIAAGYTHEACPACKGIGHFTDAPRDGSDWRRWTCSQCDGEGKVWRAPLTR